MRPLLVMFLPKEIPVQCGRFIPVQIADPFALQLKFAILFVSQQKTIFL